MFEDADTQLFEHLFTMLDEHGDNLVRYRDLLVGMALLTSGSPVQVLKTMLFLLESSQTERVSRTDLHETLSTVNKSASFFGDPVMKQDEIDALVADCFGETTSIDVSIACNKIASSAVFMAFVEGKGSVRYATGA